MGWLRHEREQAMGVAPSRQVTVNTSPSAQRYHVDPGTGMELELIFKVVV
jgi:hypothetical protein